MSDSALRALVDMRDRQIQKARIQFGNRLNALMSGDDDGGDDERQAEVVRRWHVRFQELESDLDKDIAALVKEYEIFHHMKPVKGLGPGLSAKIISMIDIERSQTVSQLWRYAGYAVIDGQRERPVKGEKLHYNKRLKTTLYLLATSFLRSNSPYRRIYDSAREHYDRTKPEWTDGHKHAAAMRKMIKVFLQHLWERWRKLEGLPTRELYVIEKLGHTTMLEAEEFDWPALVE